MELVATVKRGIPRLERLQRRVPPQSRLAIGGL